MYFNNETPTNKKEAKLISIQFLLNKKKLGEKLILPKNLHKEISIFCKNRNEKPNFVDIDNFLTLRITKDLINYKKPKRKKKEPEKELDYFLTNIDDVIKFKK